MTLIFTGRPGGVGPEAFELFGWEVEDAQGNLTSYLLLDRPIAVAILAATPFIAFGLWRRSARMRREVQTLT